MSRRASSATRLSSPAFAALATLLIAAAAAPAASLVVTTDPTGPATADGITGIATNGAGMDGMQVTATFNNGTSQTAIWQDTSATAGQAAGTGWSVSEIGDTFGGDWTLSNTTALPITSLLFDGITGRLAFDINPGSPSTPDSASGQPFTLVSVPTYDLEVIYRNPLGVGGNPPVGDLWTRMQVNFLAPAGAFGPGSTLTFETDTDNTTGAIVPEPASLVAAASLGLGAVLRRRRGHRCR